MKNNKEYYSNFKRYLKNGNRLALFGREIDGELEIFKLICSREDVENNLFSKNAAKVCYNHYLKGELKGKKYMLQNGAIEDFHPKIERIVIEKGNTAKYQFKLYCELYYQKFNQSFYPYISENGVKIEYLKDYDNNIICIGQPKWIKKHG